MAKAKKAPVVEDVEEDAELDLDDLIDDDDEGDSENSEEDEDDEDEADELETLEDIDLDDDEEEVEEEKPVKKSKKSKSDGTVEVEVSVKGGKKLKASVEPKAGKKNLPAKVSDFDPEAAAKEVSALITEVNAHYIKVAARIGIVLKQAKDHFKDAAAYKGWLEKKVCLSYSTAQQYLGVTKLLPTAEVQQKAIDANMNSAHLKELLTLKKPELVEELLDKPVHKVDVTDANGEKTGSAKVTIADCDAKDLRKVVKAMRGSNGIKERAEVPKTDQFVRFVARVTKFVTDNWDQFREFGSAKLPFKASELAKEDMVEIKNMVKIMDKVVAQYAKIRKHFE